MWATACLLALCTRGSDPSPTPRLLLRILSGDSASVSAEPGAAVPFRVVAELCGAGTAGLASFRFDLCFDGGPLAPLRAPSDGALQPFLAPAGFAAGPFGGTACAGGLRDVGAAQDTLGATAQPGLAAPGAPLSLGEGVLTAPGAPGDYLVQLDALSANALSLEGRCERVASCSAAPLRVRVGGAGEAPEAPARELDLGPDAHALARAGVTEAGYQPRAGEPLAGLSPAEGERFERGREAFVRQLKKEEGLGPGFNQDGCAACHLDPVPGGSGTLRVLRFGRAGPPFDALKEYGGGLLQERGIFPAAVEYVPPEADVAVRRTSPPLFGLGLVDRIADADLLARAGAPGAGDVQLAVPVEGGPARVGRFGWKAELPTLLSFTADAALGELGLTSRYLPAETAPNGDATLLARFDRVADPEDAPLPGGGTRIERWLDFQTMLAPPPQTPRRGMRGEALFLELGCAACHVPEWRTAPDPNPAFSEVLLRPYSDFLLHDVGSLGDGIVQGAATERRMRTAPLWGLRLRRSLLHDGRAAAAPIEDMVAQAIRAHDGEALAARDAYAALPADGQALLHAFLASLGRPEFDVDGDGDADRADWQAFQDLPRGGPIEPDDPAAVADVDADGDFDLVDLEVWMRAAGP